jgi:serine/threonine-protein kinase RsbW
MSNDGWTWLTERQIPSLRGAGNDVVQELLERLKHHDWVPHDIFGIHLAVEEALANAINHGNRLDASKSVRIVCKVSAERVRIEVHDEGEGFCPADVPDPTDEAHLDIPSGRGVMLMRNYMTLVEYNEAGNCVIMEKQRVILSE